MKLLHGLGSLLAFYLPLAIIEAADVASKHALTVWSWPIDAPSPTELAKISYNTDSLASNVQSYVPPILENLDPMGSIRIGLYDPESSDWRGSVTSAQSFDSKYQHKISIHLDHNGEAFHVNFVAFEKPKVKKPDSKDSKKTQTKEQPFAQGEPLVIEIVKPTPGPVPHLNRPVVLDATGKLPQKEEEKSFFQKYWWVFAVFLFMQIITAGAGK